MVAIGALSIIQGRLAVVEVPLEGNPPLALAQPVDVFAGHSCRHLHVLIADGQWPVRRIQKDLAGARPSDDDAKRFLLLRGNANLETKRN